MVLLAWCVGLGLVLALACGSSGDKGREPSVAASIGEASPEEVQSLLSGDALDRFQALPEDHQKALAAYLAFGVSPDLVPIVVEQKMAQWPEDPPQLRDLLGPDRYESFGNLSGSASGAPYYANFLLTYYVHVLNNEDTLEGQSQAFHSLMYALVGPTPEERRRVTITRPPLESVLTPTALARLDQLGPSFQQAIRSPWYGLDEMDLQTFAIMFTSFEILLLKTPAGTELPSIEAYLSEQELADLKTLPEDIRETVEPWFHDGVLGWFLGIAIYPSVPTLTLPPEDILSSEAKTSLSFAK